ncbi:hypothetical protein [Pontiella desulfatans]|uniref:hypothetical protein n=1 Tax=Pontiella desulfatans TaxID=2750659 RepID=UPI00109D31D4|nr:hypothetical protein [Pontiella desulfatans]
MTAVALAKEVCGESRSGAAGGSDGIVAGGAHAVRPGGQRPPLHERLGWNLALQMWSGLSCLLMAGLGRLESLPHGAGGTPAVRLQVRVASFPLGWYP